MAQVQIRLNEEELESLGRQLVSVSGEIGDDAAPIDEVVTGLQRASSLADEVAEWVVQARRMLAAQLAAA